MPLQAGQLDRRVSIRYAASVSRSATGAVTVTAGTLATVWARRTDIGGQETWRGRQLAATLDAVFLIRHRTDVTPQMQVVHGSETFEIQSVQEALGRKVALELLCRRIPVT